MFWFSLSMLPGMACKAHPTTRSVESDLSAFYHFALTRGVRRFGLEAVVAASAIFILLLAARMSRAVQRGGKGSE